METVSTFILTHAHQAHWFIFIAILLAGMSVPISIDVLMIVGAILCSTIIPEKSPYIFASLFLGCIFSAWIAYGIGRFLGAKLAHRPFFIKLLPPSRLEKAKKFYEKHGFLTLLIGRFIPFGVRNCLFMSSGMSRVNFFQFASRDFFACMIWCLCLFYLFYTIGANYQILYHHLLTINVIIFFVFSVTAIGIFWYKRKKIQLHD